MQPFVFDFKGRDLKAVVRGLSTIDLSGKESRGPQPTTGILTAETDVSVVKDEQSKIRIKASGKKFVVARLSARSLGD